MTLVFSPSEMKMLQSAVAHRKKSFEKLKASNLPATKLGLQISVNPPEVDFKKVALVQISKKKKKEIEKSNLHFFDDSWHDAESNHTLHHLHNTVTENIIFIETNKKKNANEKIVVPFTTICINGKENTTANIQITITGQESYQSVSIRALIEKDCKIHLTIIQNTSKQTYCYLHIFAKTAGTLTVTNLHAGSLFTKSENVALLTKPDATYKPTTLFAAATNQQFDIYKATYHDSPKTKSNMFSRGVISDTAKVVNRGLIRIEKAASGSEGYQKQEALMLSNTCEADAIPNLEIHNHDVKCSHGSTIGRIDPEKIFYLMSKGLSEKEAKQQIINGYFAPILYKMEKSAQESIQLHLEQTLK